MKVLLVRLSSMGDLIHTLPAVEDLARMCPQVELHWLSEAGFADIARLHPFVRKVHVLSWRQWRKQLTQADTWREISSLKQVLRQEQFDFVLDSQGLFKSALFARMAAAPIKGLDAASAREAGASWFYQQKFAVQKGLDAVLRNRLLFAQVFGYELPADLKFGVKVPLEGALQGLQSPYYVALHATSRDSKLWRQQNWLELMQKLHDRDGAQIYLPWGNPAEQARAQEMAATLPFAHVCDKMNLLQAAYLLQNAAGIIGVDTGLLHLANALDKPLVGIYTDTDPAKTGVQTSAVASNLGGVGQMPEAEAVYQQLMENMAAGQE